MYNHVKVITVQECKNSIKKSSKMVKCQTENLKQHRHYLELLITCIELSMHKEVIQQLVVLCESEGI